VYDIADWNAVSRHCQALLLGTQSCTITARSPIALAIDIIKLMRPSKLSRLSDCTLPEDCYRREFYRASGTILNGGVLWSPEFNNSKVKKGGSLDLYLAAKKWGLEFMRKETQLQLPHYHQWVTAGALLDWVVIDFHNTEPTLPRPGKHKGSDRYLLMLINSPGCITELSMLYHVCFLRDFTLAKVMNNYLDVFEEFALLEE
jgi:hypothetical protein